MIFRRKQMSDAAYVEHICKRDRTLRKIRWLWVVLFAAMICCLVGFAETFGDITADMPLERKLVYTGLFFGAMFGMMLNVVALHAGLCIKQWIDARHGFRTERLMLKYHDELKNTEASNKTAHANPLPAPSRKLNDSYNP